MAADRLIEAVQDLSGTAANRLAHLPDTATSLVFRSAAGGRADLLVVGPRTRAAYFTGKELPLCVRARLRPGAARSALGVPISELVDRVVPLTEFWGADASRLEQRLADLDGDRDLIAVRLETALRSKTGTLRADDNVRLVHAAARELASARPARLPALAHRLAVSERRLRSLFTDGAGLPPKAFARIARLHTAVTSGDRRTPRVEARHIASAGAPRTNADAPCTSADRPCTNADARRTDIGARRTDIGARRASNDARRTAPTGARGERGAGGLAELAAVSGYYDQAHMSAEFRSLLGVPPGAFFAGRLPAPVTC
ncbi:hypothetical protein AB0L06_32620 [Spirillospora sp. NPDC052269]